MVVGGLWSKGEMRTCQQPIKKLKAPKKKYVTLAQGGLTGHGGVNQLVLSAFELVAASDWL